jgi:hypothetical protein
MLERIAVASALADGNCGGSIKDAVLILSSAISAVASEIWPGEGIDRKRISEVLVKYAKNSPHPTTISIPLLYQGLDLNSAVKPILKDQFLKYPDGRILVDIDVDKNETDIISLLSGPTSNIIRRFSYANLFYTELRSGIVHEYQTTQRAYLEPVTKRSAAISYANDNSSRRIVFHFPWLVETLKSVAENVDPIFESLPLPQPTKWWIEG